MALRYAIYEGGNYWSTNSANDDANDYLSNYAPMEYLRQLTDFDCKTENYFLSFTNNAAHTSFPLQAPDYVPSANVTEFGSSKYAKNEDYMSMAGVIHRLGEWLDCLKENGAYDNSRIVIVSDHGASGSEDGFSRDDKFEEIGPGKFHPLLMFKDFGEEGKLKSSGEFMTNADAPLLAAQGIIESPKNPFTGKPLSGDAKAEGALVTTTNLFMPHHSSSKNIFTIEEDKWWRVRDSIFDPKNWTQEKQEAQR